MLVVVECGSNGGDLAVHHPGRCHDVGPAWACATATRAYSSSVRSLSTEPSADTHAAVTMVGVLVEAEVGHENQLVTRLVAQILQGNLHDAIGIPSTRAFGVLLGGHTEQHHGWYAERGELAGFFAKRVARVLDDTRQRGNGLRFVDPLAYEQGRHQVVDGDSGLGHEAP